MEFLWAFLILIGFWALTSFLSAFLGLLVPLTYLILGFILGIEPIVLGLGGLIGNIINLIFANKYMNTQGAMSNAPRLSRIASIGFIIVYIVTKIFNSIYKFEIENINWWYVLPIVVILWFLMTIFGAKNRKKSLTNFFDSVIKFKIVEKYEDNPKWATYLYFNDGEEGWNQTISGSFLAKHPENDLTFVHNTQEEALRYAVGEFKNAKHIEA